MVDFETLRRPGSPNTYLAAPAGLCREARADREAPVFSAPPRSVYDAWLRVLDGQPRTSVVHADPEGLVVEAVQRSALIGFIDDITARVLPAPSGATIAIYSASRLGRYDFGVNRKRVEAWLAALSDSLSG